MKRTAYAGLLHSTARYRADEMTRDAIARGETRRFRAMPDRDGFTVYEYEPVDEAKEAA